MQLLLSMSGALRNFHDVNSDVKDSELETELKACVHIKMMYSNLVEATFLCPLGILVG